MTDAPERIWSVHWGTVGAVMHGAWADTVRHFGGGVEYIRADLVDAQDAAWAERVAALEAAVAAARAEGMREAVPVAASLAAAISLLERGGKSAKKAAASDKMFDQMLSDYRKSLANFRAVYAEASK